MTTTTRLLRLPDVLNRIGLKKTALYDLIKRGQFRHPIKLGKTSVWPEDYVNNWIADRIREAA
jgi:prophage regulatory protein